MARQGSVFISSTSEDFKDHRRAARDAVLAVGLRPEMMEYFAAGGGPPLGECLGRVTPCDVVVVLVAKRHGWTPAEQPAPGGKSITRLECEHAEGQGKELLVFFPDEATDREWPKMHEESYRLKAAFDAGAFEPSLAEEIARNNESLKEFRKWLEKDRTRTTFTTPDNLRAKVTQALHQWLSRHPEFNRDLSQPRRQDPALYLNWLREQTATIDIRGLGVGAGKAHSFPIEELYIPLTTTRMPERGGRSIEEFTERAPMELQEALERRRLVIVGDPGSGKTTFLRRIGFELARAAQESRSGASLGKLLSFLKGGDGARSLPVFIRIAELVEHIESCLKEGGRIPRLDPEDPKWLCHFLRTKNAQLGWGLSEEFFAERLAQGEAIVLLDGLDEAPDAGQRERAARLFESATSEYRASRFVVTTRPQPYSGGALLAGFDEARIEPLTAEAVATFLERWCRGLYPESRQSADAHRDELSEALRARPEIRSMTRNPVMLTALAVVHWNERRLPEQRADLYDAVLTWLSRQREKRPGREKAERCLTLLGELALAMQKHPRGRQVRVSMEWAAEAIAVEFGHTSRAEQARRAAQFLEEECADSGIIVNRGELQFWHLTFQEYLGAQAVSGQLESEQLMLLFEGGRIYRPEWREVALLLGGILMVKQRSRAKVDAIVSAVLDRTGEKLPEKARAAGLLGAMVNDLKPLDYQPADPRYGELMDAVLGVFDLKKAAGVEFALRLEAAEALGQAGDPRIGKDNWVRIKAGTYLVGEKRGRKTTLKAFDIGKYPVTVEEYRKFVEDDGYREERWWTAGGFGQETGPRRWETQSEHPNQPVTSVSWFEARAYCAWAGVRLPADVEWEAAARGTEGREYPWGNQPPDSTRADYAKRGPRRPTPVGLYPAGATPEGVLDMAGNVWEWVEDRRKRGEEPRVLRGGSEASKAVHLRAAARSAIHPIGWDDNIGFRVVREAGIP